MYKFLLPPLMKIMEAYTRRICERGILVKSRFKVCLFIYLIVDSIKNTKLNNMFKTKFVNERLQYTLLKQSPPTSETGWLCVDVDSVAQRHKVP